MSGFEAWINTESVRRGVKVRLFKTSRGVIVRSFFSDQQAADVIGGMDRTGFIDNLVYAFRHQGWSDNMRAWAHKLAVEFGYFVKTGERVGEKIFMKGITRLFESALKVVNKKVEAPRPKITFLLDDSSVVMLSVAGPRSLYPGMINVTNGVGYDKEGNIWYGRIDPVSGVFFCGSCDEKVVRFLRWFSEDPVTAASKYGKKTGYCCFCHAPLTKRKEDGDGKKALYSADVGYGPTCAKKYGLPYGKSAALAFASEEVAEGENDTEQAIVLLDT